MKIKIGLILTVLLIAVTAGLFFGYLNTHDISLLNPRGEIAQKQYNLLIFASILSLVVVIPVFALTIGIAWRYREGNTKAKYAPNWENNKVAESIWWGIPILLIVILSIVTFISSHALDPYKKLVSSTKPIEVQVVAMQWKWLFLYPDYNIASLNYLQFPEKTPVNFTITSDAPMNSFWIPDLGGQIYAMTGMNTKLHLMADSTGSYRGSSANLSGEGFAGMTFTAKSTSQADFETWVNEVKQNYNPLNEQTYSQLDQPSSNVPVSLYSPVQPDLYTNIVYKYMDSMGHSKNMKMEGNH